MKPFTRNFRHSLYGATEIDTVLGEVRPPVGSNVAVARFQLLRPLRLLDVEALKKIFVKGSVFDPDYRRRCERARFLERVAWRIAMAVTPDDEPLDYLITQVIADYLSNAATPQLDGIIYPSVQADGAGANVVLFHKAARVMLIDLPKGTTIDASSYINDEDYEDLSYTVWEEEPEGEEKPPELDPTEWPTVTFVGNFEAERDSDERPATLSVDLETVRVHSVRAVKVSTRRLSGISCKGRLIKRG